MENYQEIQNLSIHPNERQPALLADQIMSFKVVTLNENATLEEAKLILERKGFRHIPIVTKEKELVGIISDRDLIRTRDKDLKQPVTEFMSKRVLTATTKTRIRDIAGVLLREKISCLPVLNHEKKNLVGILTVSDILRSLWTRAPLDLWT